MTVLRVAAAQAQATSGDVEGNVASAARLTEQAARRGVRLLVLPEACVTGYDEAVFAGPVPTPAALPEVLAPLTAAADADGVVVVGSTPLRRPDLPRPTMSSFVLDAGQVVLPYDKQHLDDDESTFFDPGRCGGSIVVDGVELGLAICYDTSFPEHARAAADAGALGYLASAAFFPGSDRRRDLALASRAVDNGVYVVAACATGRTGPRTLIGGSTVIAPDGEVLALLGEEEGLAVADLDTEVVAEVRRSRPLAADRRPDLGVARRTVLGP